MLEFILIFFSAWRLSKVLQCQAYLLTGDCFHRVVSIRSNDIVRE